MCIVSVSVNGSSKLFLYICRYIIILTLFFERHLFLNMYAFSLHCFNELGKGEQNYQILVCRWLENTWYYSNTQCTLANLATLSNCKCIFC